MDKVHTEIRKQHKNGPEREITHNTLLDIVQILFASITSHFSNYPSQAIRQIKILAESKHIFEEEVPRSGIFIVRVHQIARDTDGELHHWQSRKKNPDERRKTSGLLFDRLINIK